MFPKYPVLEKIKEKYPFAFNPDEYYIISVQHLLRSNGSMFETLINYGFKPQNIFLTGKIYSTHDKTKNKLKQLGINIIESTYPKKLGYYKESLEKDVSTMWSKLSQALKPNSKIIILDDGGYVLKSVPEQILRNYCVNGIEQTTSGIKMQNNFGQFPVIHVASSAAKVIIEPPIVSEAVNIQLGNIIEKVSPKKMGIVGFGHIGKAVVNEFKTKYDILIYDIKNEVREGFVMGANYCSSLEELYAKSDVIIGATGQDISDLNWLKKSNGDKTLISVSSSDVEFNRLIKECENFLTEPLNSPLQVLNLKTEDGNLLSILRGGMVANFTGKPDSSPGHIIQLTQGLLLSAILQILRDEKILKTKSGAIILDPDFQKEVVKLWFQDQPQRKSDYSAEIIKGFEKIEWIKEKSRY